MRSFFVLCSFAASALAYQVTSPSATKGWTNDGAQTLTWQRVDTDPLNFTVVLTNEDRNVMPINDQVLAAQVDGKLLTIGLNPPSAGWPTGSNFRVNLVKDQESLDTILAQSNEFDIKAPETTSSRLTATTRPFTTAPQNTGTTPTGTASNPASTDNNSPPGTNSALGGLHAQAGLLSLCAFLGFFLV